MACLHIVWKAAVVAACATTAVSRVHVCASEAALRQLCGSYAVACWIQHLLNHSTVSDQWNATSTMASPQCAWSCALFRGERCDLAAADRVDECDLADDVDNASDERRLATMHTALFLHNRNGWQAELCALPHTHAHTGKCAHALMRAQATQRAVEQDDASIVPAVSVPDDCCVQRIPLSPRHQRAPHSHAHTHTRAVLIGARTDSTMHMNTSLAEWHIRSKMTLSPFWDLGPGVLALSRGQSFLLPRASLPAHAHAHAQGKGGASVTDNTTAAWSLCAWWWWDAPPEPSDASTYIPLFYKGFVTPSHAHARTPSIMLRAETGEMSLRVSQSAPSDEPDVGVDLDVRLPRAAWTHTCMDFQASTDGYRARTFIDGELRSTVTFTQPSVVAANDGPLTLGWVPGLEGWQGLNVGLRVFDTGLDLASAYAEYSRSRQMMRQQRVGLHRSTRRNSVVDHLTDLLLDDANARWSRQGTNVTEHLFQVWDEWTSTCTDARNDTLGQRLVEQLSTAWLQDGDADAGVRIAAALLQPTHAVCLNTLLQHAMSELQRKDLGRQHAVVGVVRSIASAMRDAAAWLLPMSSNNAPGGGADSISLLLLKRRQAPTLACDILAKATAAQRGEAWYLWAVYSWTGMCDALPARRIAAMLILSSMHGSAEAAQIMGRWYAGTRSATQPLDRGSINVELAAHYAHIAALEADELFHRPGYEPRHEFPLLTEFLDDDSRERGERGEDDPDWDYHRLLVSQGNTNSMQLLADAYYWGKYGLPRDQPQAAQLWQRAADAGSAPAQAALGGLYVRGEGVPRDYAKAMQLYEQAAASNMSSALNGLGYIVFQGLYNVTRNVTRAFQLFESAAERGDSADGLLNAAHCLAHGQGVRINTSRALILWQQAAATHGSFPAMLELGRRYLLGEVPEPAPFANEEKFVASRDATSALPLLQSASEWGPWASLSRRAFNYFLARDFQAALAAYMQGVALGVRGSSLNAALLLHRGLAELPGRSPQEPSQDGAVAQRLLEHALTEGFKEATLPLGELYMSGDRGATRDVHRAAHFFADLAFAGDPAGAFHLGSIVQSGLVVVRDGNATTPEDWYRLSIQLGSTSAAAAPAALALARLTLRPYLALAMPLAGVMLAAVFVIVTRC